MAAVALGSGHSVHNVSRSFQRRLMIPFPPIDPIAFKIDPIVLPWFTFGPIAVHWYGLSYITGIVLGWILLHDRAGRSNGRWSRDQVADVVFYAALGAVLGGRAGYILFYNLDAYLAAPLTIFAVWQGGMAFHGGVLGLTLALVWYARTQQRTFREVADFLVPAVPIGLGLGRLANFVNQELWGAPTTLPWGVLFNNPLAGAVPRHPSQLYEAALEGVVLFVILNAMLRKPRPTGHIMACFLLFYGLFRFAVEFVRDPDPQIGYLAFDWLTMGQLLSLPMILVGGLMLALIRAR